MYILLYIIYSDYFIYLVVDFRTLFMNINIQKDPFAYSHDFPQNLKLGKSRSNSRPCLYVPFQIYQLLLNLVWHITWIIISYSILSKCSRHWRDRWKIYRELSSIRIIKRARIYSTIKSLIINSLAKSLVFSFNKKPSTGMFGHRQCSLHALFEMWNHLSPCSS